MTAAFVGGATVAAGFVRKLYHRAIDRRDTRIDNLTARVDGLREDVHRKNRRLEDRDEQYSRVLGDLRETEAQLKEALRLAGEYRTAYRAELQKRGELPTADIVANSQDITGGLRSIQVLPVVVDPSDPEAGA
ncbi:MAG: hypothetical protein ACPG77_14275 [Nannocystaceae bacterium]